MYAAIRIRGSVGVRGDIEQTLKYLRLNRVNHCVLIKKDGKADGMLRKVSGFITWGEINPEVLDDLVAKRGRLHGDVRLDAKAAKEAAEHILKHKTVKDMKIKPVFRLSPPKKGLRTIKLPFPKGDAGYRGDKINKLLERMI
jgi:large subunit ribosomal protein L30